MFHCGSVADLGVSMTLRHFPNEMWCRNYCKFNFDDAEVRYSSLFASFMIRYQCRREQCLHLKNAIEINKFQLARKLKSESSKIHLNIKMRILCVPTYIGIRTISQIPSQRACRCHIAIHHDRPPQTTIAIETSHKLFEALASDNQIEPGLKLNTIL